MSSEQDKKMNPNPEELETIEDDKLDNVAGGFWGEEKEGLCSTVRSMVADAADRCFKEGMDRDDCGEWINTNLYDRLCQINESKGYQFHIDWMYLNHIIDARYGIA